MKKEGGGAAEGLVQISRIKVLNGESGKGEVEMGLRNLKRDL